MIGDFGSTLRRDVGCWSGGGHCTPHDNRSGFFHEDGAIRGCVCFQGGRNGFPEENPLERSDSDQCCAVSRSSSSCGAQVPSGQRTAGRTDFDLDPPSVLRADPDATLLKPVRGAHSGSLRLPDNLLPIPVEQCGIGLGER